MDVFRRQKFNEAMFAKNRTLAIRVGQYQSSDIKEASFEYGYIKGDAYKPGGTCAGSGKITFTSIITTFNKLDKIYPEIGLLVDGTYEWVKMGEYFINDIEIDRNRNTTTLDLMDGMFKLNREHITSLTYPAEIRHVIKEICLKTGVELANENMDLTSMNYQIEKIPREKKMTFRDVLSLATQMLGMSCFFNREGKLEIKELTDSGITITADSYFMHGLTKSEVQYRIAGITCKKDKETLTVGLKSGRSLELDNLFMSQSILDNLYHKIKDIRYYPFNLNYQGHLLLDVGQWVTIKTNTGETFKSPVLSQSFTFKGGLRGRISADSKAGNDAQYSYAGTLTKKIEQFNEFEAQIQNQIEEADKGFEQKVNGIKKDFSDQVELAKARAEEVKRQLSDTIDQRFNSFDVSGIAEAKRKAEEALEKSGANTSLIDEALSIGRKTRMRLDRLKRDFESAGEITDNLLGEIDRNLKQEVNTNSEYRRTTNEMLSRMTGQMDGFATKSEVKQDIDGLTRTFAKMKVGGRNYAEDYDFSRGLWQYSQGDSSPQDWTILKGEYNVKGTTNTWKQMQIHSKEGSKTSGKNSTALLDLEIGETYTLSFQGICYSGSPKVWLSLRANRTVSNNPEIMYGIFNLTSSWQTYQVTIPALTKPDNFDFWRIILGYSEIGHVAFRKVELTRSSTRIDAGPAPEDGKNDLVAAKSEFHETAEGLSSKMTAVERYVNQDGQRQEALQRYAREESAKQATSVRELVSRDFVGKSIYQEDVKGINQKIEAVKTTANKEIATQIANYRQSIDGKFTDISSQVTTYKQVADGQIANLSNQLAKKVEITDFQRVRETSQLYERILGNTENGIADKVARMALTNQLFQVEVGKYGSDGINRALNTSKGWTSFITIASPAGVNLNADLHKVVASGLVAGDKLHVRLEISIDDVQPITGKTATAVLQSWGDVKKWNSGNPFGYRLGSLIAGNNWRKIEYDVTLTEQMLGNNFWWLNVRVDGASRYKVNTKLLKIEKGSRATPWSPAPEDTEEAVRTVQSQLAGSWSVQNINSAGDLISGINLGANGHNRFDGKLTHITGETLIDKAVIKSAMVDKLKTANFEAGSVTTVVLDAEAVTAEKLKVDQAFFNKLVANEAYLNQLFAKQAFINRVKSITIDASQVSAGVLRGASINSLDDSMRIDTNKKEFYLNNNTLFTFFDQKEGLHSFIGTGSRAVNGEGSGIIIGSGLDNQYTSQLRNNTSNRDLWTASREMSSNLLIGSKKNGNGQAWITTNGGIYLSAKKRKNERNESGAELRLGDILGNNFESKALLTAEDVSISSSKTWIYSSGKMEITGGTGSSLKTSTVTTNNLYLNNKDLVAYFNNLADFVVRIAQNAGWSNVGDYKI